MMFPNQLTEAFKALRKRGYFARHNFWCCQTCGNAAIEDDVMKYVFYHHQDYTAMKEALRGDKPEDIGVYLAWGGKHQPTEDIGKEIVSILEGCGLHVEWDGSENTRIWVGLKPEPLPPTYEEQLEALLAR